MNWLRNSAVVALVACMMHGLGVEAVAFYQCASGPAPISILINGKEPTMPVQFRPDEEFTVELTFKIVANSDTLRPELALLIFNLPVPIDVPSKNACSYLVGRACPVTANEIVTLKQTARIPKDVPPTVGRGQLKIVGSNKEVHVCLQIAAQITG